MHLTIIKDLQVVPFDFVLRAYTAFFHCFEFSSSFVASFVDIFFLIFGFTRKIVLRLHRIPKIRMLFLALPSAFVRSLLTLSSPHSALSSLCPLLLRPLLLRLLLLRPLLLRILLLRPLLTPPSPTLISLTQNTILINSELGTNSYLCTYLMSCFVTFTLTYTHIHIHTHTHASLIRFVFIWIYMYSKGLGSS